MIAQGAGRNLLAIVLAAAMVAGCLDETPARNTTDAEGIDTPVRPDDHGNTAPVIEGVAPASVVVGTSYLFQPRAYDADGDALRFSVTGLPAWASFDATRGEIHGSPAASDAGITADIQVSVSDGEATASLPPFHIIIEPVPLPPAPPPAANRAPTLAGTPPGQVQATRAYRFTPEAHDPENSALEFTIQRKPAWASFSSADGTIAGTPGPQQVGRYRNIVITVSDGQLQASLPPFSIEVTAAPNRAPTLSGTPPSTAEVDATYRFQPRASDEDGDTLHFSASGLPSWLQLDPASGLLQGRPARTDAGSSSTIRLSVTDGTDTTSLPPFTLTVGAAPNSPPSLAGIPSTGATVDQPYSFHPSGHDSDGQTLVYSVRNLPSWAHFDTATGALTGTPGAGDAGTWAGIVISASDGTDSRSLPAFSITVSAMPNAAPTISGSPATQITAGQAYHFRPQASDPDGQPLSFSIQGQPAWASFDATTGTLAGTPERSHAGQYRNIVISVSDGAATASLPAFQIRVVEPPNQAPVIAGSPATQVTAGDNYRFTPTASDADGDGLTFSISNRPAWASFNSSNGMLSGTPAREQAGTYPGIVIRVSDGTASASLPAFQIRVVEPPNQAPVIAGSPATQVTAGENYRFTPTASDADGDSLTFSVQNLPAWANFSASSGRLSGTPGAADAGTYSGIVISVSDGTASASLPAFAITVHGPATGEATLGWSAPSRNEDGSALTDLAGYHVYSGRNGQPLSRIATLDSPAATSTTVRELGAGTYCFAVSAFTHGGTESERSASACKTIP